ncbi:uncharacterized protein [Sinocyclocheilus grahami]|uniref:uncharacterized protein n=1 Tax=Sinocyclocheilus grahami TaxID=75366 RepID=UPI0007AD4AB2|nr:PREDICTED: uncharacterized protein LOC107602270 [Sinocyclocheilus grahami]XP_016150218.1 PREDICTED: uncharacterized protein LOC107602270 [Sinocyclocheilus grahami]XP_016150219.1 PREDICTED: uncharacterized protein LOC107602270 [Sinocyclocheilus grahami]
MGECMLDRHGEDGFQSCDGFDDWSTFSSADWTEPQQDGSGVSDWGAVQDKTRKEESSTLPVAEAGTFEFPENTENGDKGNPWFIFNDCFQEAETDPVMMEIPTLSLLQQSVLDKPSHSAAISSEAANFWCHLQSGSKILRLSGPKPKLHSHKGLLKTLQLRQPDASAHSQTTTLLDLELEDLEDPPGPLIQTKLMPSSQCQNAPGFFYQISRQWLSQYNMNLLPYQNKKDPLQ